MIPRPEKLAPCVPPNWARTGHAQTLLGSLIPSPPLKDPGERVEVPLDGGDVLIGHLHPGRSNTVVYLFHGLSGTADADYMTRTTRVAQGLGHTVCRINHRGCGEGEGFAVEPYHSGRGEDLSAVIAWGRKRFPEKRHVAVGFSLSGNALLLLMAGVRGDCPPDAGIAVAAPFDLEKTSWHLREGLNRIYDVYFVFRCTRQVEAKRRAGLLEERPTFPLRGGMLEFDARYTAPFGGFPSREHYYRECSSGQYLTRITRPLVLMTALDDPFVMGEDYLKAKLSSSIEPHFEQFGGHLGFLQRGQPRRWLDGAMHWHLSRLTS